MILLYLFAVIVVFLAVNALRAGHLTVLEKLQIILTACLVAAVAVVCLTLGWFNSLASADPMLRKVWQIRIDVICDLILYGTFIPWLLISIYHVIVGIRRRLLRRRQPKLNH